MQTAQRKVTALLRRIAVLQKKAILKRAVRRIKKVYIKHEVLKKESASHNQQILFFALFENQINCATIDHRKKIDAGGVTLDENK